jgi:hypothetical protein
VKPRIGYFALGIGFVLLATMNSAGYRYAASDQAFYIPAVLRHLQPSLFPRDAALIDSQARLTLVDEVVATLVRVTGLSLQHLFIGLYVLTLLLLVAGAARIGAHFYRTRWAVVALGAALTLRHAIAKTGANTLEGYFHPRELAFALGLLAVAAFLERRGAWCIVFLVGAAGIHPTTAAWFLVWIAIAVWVGRRDWRAAVAAGAGAIVVAVVISVLRGPLAGHMTIMDSEWLAVIRDKDYLFPFTWPLNVWLTNLVTVPVIVYCWRARRRAGQTLAGESALVIGALGLFALFVCWLPLNGAHVALAVQMQVSRIFWMLDVFATIYLVGWIAEGTQGPKAANGAAARWRAPAVACTLIALSLGRGIYSLSVQFPERKIFAADIQHTDWRSAMAFADTTDPGSGWLADPIHAAKYGASVRAAGHRDVLLEQIKDSAIAMYDRDIAMRVADRERALAVLAWDTPEGARGLARRFGLDYLVIDRPLDLPLAHRSGSLYIYRLR